MQKNRKLAKKPFITAAVMSASLVLAGCSVPAVSALVSANADSTASGLGSPAENTITGSLSPDTLMAENADYTVVNEDEWSINDAVDIELSESTASSSAQGVTVSGSTVTITEGGVYRVTGSLDGRIVIEAGDDDLVVLVLDDAEITSSDGAAVEVVSADDVAIHLADGSSNRVVEASAADSETKAAIYAASDLTFSGGGSLTVEGQTSDGISTKDDLVVLSGNITVTAADDALRGRDSLVVEGGTLDLTATGGDGMTSDGDGDGDEAAEGSTDVDWTGGYIYVSGGSIEIDAGDDGLQAFTDTVIAGGDLTVSAADDGVKAEVAVAIGPNEADGGGGSNGPTVNVIASTEGIEAANIGLSGGTISVAASDDGVNASGNADLQALISGSGATETSLEESTEPGAGGGEFGGGPGGGEFQDSGERLEISGGTITVDAEGDGLDSNGSLTISGGDITVYGPTMGGNGSLDANGEITVTDGTLVSFGPGSMEETPGTDGQGWVLISAQLAAGDSAEIVAEDGTVLAEVTATKAATTVIFSSVEVTSGATYSLVSNGQVLGTATAGEGGSGMGGPGQGGMGEGAPGPGTQGEGAPSGMGDGGPTGSSEGHPGGIGTSTSTSTNLRTA